MKKLLILGAVAGLAVSANANLIVDGGFELGDVYAGQFDGAALSPWSTQYGYATNNNQSSGDMGSIWHEGNMRVMQGQASNNGSTGHVYWDAVSSNEGASFLAVNGATQGGQNQPFVLSQTFAYAGTGPLNVKLDSVNLYKPDANGASTIAVWLDGNLLGSTATQLDNVWRTASFNGIVANTGMHTLRIVANTTQFSGNDFGLDNVQVNAVPEPFTMTLGLASAGLFVRRRLKGKKA